jgi:hypothetical protein
MNKPAIYKLAFNAIGILIGIVVVGYVVFSLFETTAEPSCAQTFPAPHRFALTSATGERHSPITLQARAGLREWGMTENIQTVPEPGMPGGAALQVRLAQTSAEDAGGRPANGVSFRWTPPDVDKAQAACLSYRVWLPEDFAFGDGGILPGLFGGLSGIDAADVDEETRFGAYLGWDRTGAGILYAKLDGTRARKIGGRSRFAVRQGRWTHIAQELVLNTPGETDGRVRVWVDGHLKADVAKLALRRDAKEGIGGVLADIGYLQEPKTPGMLRLSPFELSWR